MPLKLATLFNVGIVEYPEFFIRGRDITPLPFDRPSLDKLISEAVTRRCVVIVSRREKDISDVMGGFSYKPGNDWNIYGGFMGREKVELFQWLTPKRGDNALALLGDKVSGRVAIMGDGAGVGPTISAMLRDARRLTKQSK